MAGRQAKRLTLFLTLLSGFFVLSFGMTLVAVPGRTAALISSVSPARKEIFTVINFGDAMFGRNVEKRMAAGADPLGKIPEITGGAISNTDIVIANLEGPITEAARCVVKDYSFKFKPEIGNYLARSGFTHMNLANNHSLDCYESGLSDTRDYLGAAGIGYFGGTTLPESFTTTMIHGQKIALVGIDETIRPVPLQEFYPLVAALKKENDFVIVNIHWGNEYEKMPAPRQTEIGHALIDAGADIVFGHHPHVTEPIELYKNGVIFYSLGNFVFDQITEEQNTGFGVFAEFENKNANFKIFPYFINRSVPEPLRAEARESYCFDLLSGIPESDPKTCSFRISRIE